MVDQGLVFGLGGVMLVLHTYLYWRLILCTGMSHKWRIVGGVTLALLWGILVTSLATQRSGEWQHLTLLHATGMGWMALVIYLMLTLILFELLRLGLLIIRRARRRDPDLGRRLLLARVGAVTAGIVATGLVGFGLTQALGRIRTAQATIVLANLPLEFQGYRIAVATDLHLGALSGRARTQEVVNLINNENVDLVALVGDLSDGLPSDLTDATAPLTDILAPDGILFTTGNHEYYTDAAAWRAALPEMRITVLHNESHPIQRGTERLFFAGINDYTGQDHADTADLTAALTGSRPDDVVILLAHQPRQAVDADAAGVDLQLSGHTHGGQFWPFHLLVSAQQGTLAGLSQQGHTQVWTSRGAGFWGPPIRIGAPPDITILTLVRS